MYGYHGRVLTVDLTRRESRWETLAEDVLRRFIGGIGLGHRNRRLKNLYLDR
jgi:aldehyde:ferredoxin oxidoreductase